MKNWFGVKSHGKKFVQENVKCMVNHNERLLKNSYSTFSLFWRSSEKLRLYGKPVLVSMEM